MKPMLLDPKTIKPVADQPRKRFRGIPQLAESIRVAGQVTPIVVTACRINGFSHELVDGERRLQACLHGQMRIKAVLADDVGEDERFAMSIAANFCRQEHDAIEIAEAVARLRDQGRSVAEIAGIFGKTTTWVYQHASLLSLHPDVQTMLQRAGDERRETQKEIRQRGRMTLSIAMLLIALPPEAQLKAARHIAGRKLSMAAARNHVLNLGKAAGVKMASKKSPRQDFMAIWNLMDACRNRVARFIDMPHTTLRTIVATASGREAAVLAGQIEELSANLAGLAKELKRAQQK